MRKKKTISKPPAAAVWLLKRILPKKDSYFLLGDFEEIFNEKAVEKGAFSAAAWYWAQALRNTPGFLLNSIYWSMVMLKNYFKIAVRNIVKSKGYSLINITGLVVGIVSCLLITLWILDELSFDRFHEKNDRLYHVLVHGSHKNNPSTPAPLAAALLEEIPEITAVTRYDGTLQQLVRQGDKVFYESNLKAVDAGFFKMFSFPFVKGSPETALRNVNSIVISAAAAEKYFGDEDPMGKVLTMNNKRQMTVTGVIKNVPHNSTLQFDMLLPYEVRIANMKEQGWDLNAWGAFAPSTFIELRSGSSAAAVEQKIRNFLHTHMEGEDAVLSILPFAERNLFFSAKKQILYIFSAIAFFILLIACINFMNLSTARSANRAKEIGVRKVTGADRKNIIIQFLSESLLLSFAAFIIALILAVNLLPVFNAVIGVDLAADILKHRLVLPVMIALVLFTGLAAGSYPALFLSAFQPHSVLSGKLKAGAKGSFFRRVLVVFQFSLSVFLIIGTIIVYKQVQYLKSWNLGYDKEQILNVGLKGDSRNFFNVLKNRLLADERILNVTGTMDDLPYFGWSSGTADWEGKDPAREILTYNNIVGYDFDKTLKINMAAGRGFSEDFTDDAGTGYVINEEMAALMGLEPQNAVGARLTYWKKPGKVVGVMKNFNFQPLTHKINPLVLVLAPEKLNFMVIRMRPGDISSTVDFLKKTWKGVVPMFPIEFNFLDETFNRSFRSIERMGNMTNIFTFLAVFIAGLGLFGLASFTAEQRSKEIGIRKVHGASVPAVIVLLSKEFTRCVLAANLIAWPLAYFALSLWLKNFAYRTGIGITVFIFSGLAAFVIALLTVSYQSIKAATANPVDALKYE